MTEDNKIEFNSTKFCLKRMCVQNNFEIKKENLTSTN